LGCDEGRKVSWRMQGQTTTNSFELLSPGMSDRRILFVMYVCQGTFRTKLNVSRDRNGKEGGRQKMVDARQTQEIADIWSWLWRRWQVQNLGAW
jgi:hypothetical protein